MHKIRRLSSLEHELVPTGLLPSHPDVFFPPAVTGLAADQQRFADLHDRHALTGQHYCFPQLVDHLQGFGHVLYHNNKEGQ